MENSRRGVSGKMPDFLGTGRGFKPGSFLFFFFIICDVPSCTPRLYDWFVQKRANYGSTRPMVRQNVTLCHIAPAPPPRKVILIPVVN